MLDVAKQSEHRSLRALALAMQAHPAWPIEDVRTAEGLANKLRDLDKGKDAAWWFGTGNTLRAVLAEVLNESCDDLDALIQARAPGEAGAGRFLFEAFSDLRSLVLAEEPLPPGLPSAIESLQSAPSRYTWWTAPAGAGKRLVGEWLRARFGWRVVHCANWMDLLAEVVKPGNHFVVLEDPTDADLGALRELLEAGRVCIAAPAPPPAGDRGEDRADRLPWSPEPNIPGWAVCTTPPLRSWLTDLIEWVAARITPGSGFDAELVRNAALNDAFDGLLDTPGGAIELFGVIDRVGAKKVFRDEAGGELGTVILTDWLKHARANAKDLPAAAHAVLRERGVEVLVHMETERLRALQPQVLTADAWAAYVPEGPAPQLDPAALLRQLDHASADDLRVALATHPRAIVDSLRGVGALVSAPGGLAYAHRWLASILRDEAAARLYAEGGVSIGTALLNAEVAGTVLEALLLAAVSEPAVIRAAASAGLDTPEGAAAVNGAFRAVGLAMALGHEVDAELALAVWRAQAAGLGQRYANWPRLPVLDLRGVGGAGFLLKPGAWMLAALTLSRLLPHADRGEGGAEWDIWSEAGLLSAFPPDALRRVLSTLWGNLDRTAPAWEQSEWVLAVCRLGGALLDAVGPVGAWHLPTALCADALVLAAEGHLQLDESATERVIDLPSGLPALRDACERREVPFEHVIRWCWERWGASPTSRGPVPPLRWLHGHGPVGEAALHPLWEQAPPGRCPTTRFGNLSIMLQFGRT